VVVLNGERELRRGKVKSAHIGTLNDSHIEGYFLVKLQKILKITFNHSCLFIFCHLSFFFPPLDSNV
jgi:hypothetical protein